MDKLKGNIIFIIGGVMSGIGKERITASIASILTKCNLKINILNLNPYLNLNYNNINNYNNDNFVTMDGIEVDSELCFYNYLTKLKLKKNNILSTGQIYDDIISNIKKNNKEIIQIVPHVTDYIINYILKYINNYDIIICDVGGTIGDIESMIYLEAIRRFKGLYPNNTVTIFLTYIPYLKLYDEFKTKPARDSIKSLYESGMVPDIIICRYEKIQIKQKFINKISIFSNIPEKRIFLSPIINNIYELPYIYIKQNMHIEILNILNIKKFKMKFKSLYNLYNIINNIKGYIYVNIIGKQVYSNKYLPLIESLKHASYQLNKNIKINWIKLYHNNDNIDILKNKQYGNIIIDTYDTIDISCKLSLIKYIRQNNIPCLGICNGMHLMLIEYIKEFINIDVNSLIIKNNKKILGYTKIKILPNTKAYNIYNSNTIKECHKHYSEINIKYKSEIEKNGLIFSGLSNKNNIEILEITSLNFYMGIQYFPEFNTSIFKPNRLICSFLKKAYKYQKNKN